MTARLLVALWHDTFWRYVDEGRSLDDAATLARIDLQDRLLARDLAASTGGGRR